MSHLSSSGQVVRVDEKAEAKRARRGRKAGLIGEQVYQKTWKHMDEAERKQTIIEQKIFNLVDGRWRDLTRNFRKADADFDGSLDVNEFATALRGIGVNLSSADVDHIFEHLDEAGGYTKREQEDTRREIYSEITNSRFIYPPGNGKIKYEQFENRLRWKDFEEIRKSHPPYLEAKNYDGTNRDWSKAEIFDVNSRKLAVRGKKFRPPTPGAEEREQRIRARSLGSKKAYYTKGAVWYESEPAERVELLAEERIMEKIVEEIGKRDL